MYVLSQLPKSIFCTLLLWHGGVYFHLSWHLEHLTTSISHLHLSPFVCLHALASIDLVLWISVQNPLLSLTSFFNSFTFSSQLSLLLSPSLHLSSKIYPCPLTHCSYPHLPPIIPALRCQFIRQSGKQSQMSQRMMDEAAEGDAKWNRGRKKDTLG